MQAEISNLQTLRDITHRLNAVSQAKLDSEEYMVAFVDSMPLPAWIKDIEGNMRFLNNAYEKIYDIKRENYIGKQDSDVWPQDIADDFKRMDDAVLLGDSVEYSVERVNNRAGFRKYDHLHVVKFPLYSGPDVVGIAGIITGVFP